MRRPLSLLIALCIFGTPITVWAFVFKLVTGSNLAVPVPSQSIASTSISCGSSCSATAGTGSTIGTFSATLSPATPAFTGSWSLQTTGSVSGTTCDNSGFFSVSGNSLNVSSSATAATYHPCYVATQTGLGGSPKANVVSVAVNSSGGTIACDIGPPYTGSIPVPAQNAGFTHCVANWDFTQTQSWTDTVGTHQWSNLSSWLDCAGAGSNTILYAVQNTTCSDISIVTNDPSLSGTQVLKAIYTPSDTNGATYLWSDSNFGYPNSPGLRTHEGFYTDEVWRATSDSFNTCASGHANCSQYIYWFFQINASCNPNCSDLEVDVNEVFGGPSGLSFAAAHSVSPNTELIDFGTISGYDRTQYNTVGMLTTVTNGGSPNYEACAVLNNVSRNSCGTGSISQTAISTTTLEYYVNQVGPYCSGSGCSPTSNVTQYTQRATIWSCAGYSGNTSGAPCYTSSLMSY